MTLELDWFLPFVNLRHGRSCAAMRSGARQVVPSRADEARNAVKRSFWTKFLLFAGHGGHGDPTAGSTQRCRKWNRQTPEGRPRGED